MLWDLTLAGQDKVWSFLKQARLILLVFLIGPEFLQSLLAIAVMLLVILLMILVLSMAM